MKNFFLYRKETEKPHFVLCVGERAWLVPFLKPFEEAKKRLAVEVAPHSAGITLPPGSDPDMIESGEAVVKIDGKRKFEFAVSANSGSFLNGNFVLILPSWGRNTERKLWVLVKSKQKSKRRENDKAHSSVEIERQGDKRSRSEKDA